jgi:hypothetical protein
LSVFSEDASVGTTTWIGSHSSLSEYTKSEQTNIKLIHCDTHFKQSGSVLVNDVLLCR